LRLFRLGEQVLGGDELHGVRVALAEPVGRILTTYRTADPGLPLAAFFRALMDAGVQPAEWTFRLPVLLFALATPLLIPGLALRLGWLERRAALWLAWLLALSPLLVLYGRIVRPYGIVVLLVFLALGAFFRFWEATRGRWGWGATFALCGASALYLNLIAAPVLMTPWLFAGLDLLKRRNPRAAARLASLALLAAACGAAFLIPAWDSFRALTGAKGGAGALPWETVESGLLLLAGTPLPTVAALFWGGAAVGCVLFVRAHRRPGLFLLTGFVGHLGGLLLLAPFGMESPAVFSRYLLVLLPIALLWIAHALAHLWPRHQPILAAALVAGLFLATPLARPAWWATSFLHHADTLRFDRPRPTVTAGKIPTPYRLLGEVPPGPIVEAPVRTPWRFARAPFAYQRHHGRRVLLLSDDPQLCDPRLALRNHICPTPESLDALRQRGAVALVVHLDPMTEEGWVEGPPPARDRRAPQTRRRLAAQAQRLTEWLEGELGPPAIREDGVGVWVL
jgi:hypothetical protein